MSIPTLTEDFRKTEQSILPPDPAPAPAKAEVVPPAEEKPAIEQGEGKGIFNAYIMPDGHTLYMTEKMFKDIGHDALLEIGRMTAGKDTLIATKSEALRTTISDADRAFFEDHAYAFAYSEAYFSPHRHPLSNIAKNLIVLPESNDKALSAKGSLPWEIFELEPDCQRGIWITIALHEAGHIKDLINRNPFERLFNIRLDNEESLAQETYADNLANDAAKRLGYGYEADLFLAEHIIGFFSVLDDKDIKPGGYDHTTFPLVGQHIRADADAYLDDAKKYYGEIGNVIALLNRVGQNADNPALSREFKELSKNIEPLVRQNKEYLPEDIEAVTWANSMLCARYAATKALLEQDMITDPEQKAYAGYFVEAMERHLNPALLHEIQSGFYKEIHIALANMDPAELRAAAQQQPPEDTRLTHADPPTHDAAMGLGK